MEIELSFRLDGHGRTAPSRENEHQRPADEQDEPAQLDYQSKTILTNLVEPSSSSVDTLKSHQQWIDNLLFDCQISDSGLMPRTFWVPAQGRAPRCHLEQMALDIFHHHVPSSADYDVSCSGVEWWTQIRPSPEGTGRYSMHDDQPDDLARTGISFHWDKDEDLRLLMGGTTYIHPHLSTVTYLTDIGSPTLTLSHRVNSLTGEWVNPSDGAVEGFVSWPLRGKHLSFDGRYLHAAPGDLMEPGNWEKQLELPQIVGEDEATKQKQAKLLRRRHRRVTFLVNIWLNYKPFDVKPFPDTMIDKMSGTDEFSRMRLEFLSKGEMDDDSGTTTTQKISNSDSDHIFTWPMGDCGSNEFIEAHMPLDTIRQEASRGGNVRIYWRQDATKKSLGARLRKGTGTSQTSVAMTNNDHEKRKLRDSVEDKDDTAKRAKVEEDSTLK